MFFRSTLLLKLVVLVGFVIALAGLVVAAFEVVDYIAGPNRRVPGYTSLAVLVLVMAGVIIISVGVVGLFRRARSARAPLTNSFSVLPS